MCATQATPPQLAVLLTKETGAVVYQPPQAGAVARRLTKESRAYSTATLLHYCKFPLKELCVASR